MIRTRNLAPVLGLFLTLSFFASSCSQKGASAPGGPEAITQGDVDATIKKYPSVLVAYKAKWCGTCKSMEPKLAQLENEGQLKVLRIDIDESPTVSDNNHISAIPVFVAYKNGKQVQRIEGAQTLEMLKAPFLVQ